MSNGPGWKVTVGDVLTVLRGMGEKIVHCIITSPPYLWLRVYKDGDEVIAASVWPPVPEAGHWADGWPEADWSLVDGCEHEWGDATERPGNAFRNGEGTGSEFAGRADKADINEAMKPTASQFCRKCGCWLGHYGSEPTVTEYLWHTVIVCRLLRRVLRDDGTLWWNIADTMAGTGSGKGTGNFTLKDVEGATTPPSRDRSIPAGTAIGVPERTMLALAADGWRVKPPVVWAKKSPMPESVDGWRWQRCRVKVGRDESTRAGIEQGRPGAANSHDPGPAAAPVYADCPGCDKCRATGGWVLRRGQWRPTRAHEIILQLVKTDRYYGDREGVGTIATPTTRTWAGNGKRWDERKADGTHGRAGTPASSANPRGVQYFKPTPLKGAHYASFPMGLPIFCIRASTSDKGVCPECGAPWARMIETGYRKHRPSGGKTSRAERGNRVHDGGDGNWGTFGTNLRRVDTTLGWRQTCACDADEPIPATVLDPFAGSGTTLKAAVDLGRHALGVEVSGTYVRDILEPRMRGELDLPEPDDDPDQMELFGGTA